jgi:hypothetical protein
MFSETRIGYLYYSDLLGPPNDIEQDRLVAAGAEIVYVDWGSRLHYEWLQEKLTQKHLTHLFLCRLEDLGDTVAVIHSFLVHLQQAQVSLHLVGSERILTPDTPECWIQLLTNLPSSLQSRRVRRAHHQNRLDLKPPPGPSPYGYQRDTDRYILNRKQALVVKDFFDHFLLYGSLRESVRYLAQKHGKKMSVATGRQWLSSAVYRGDLAFGDGSVIRNTHPAILSRQEAAQIDRWLRRNRGMPRRSASAGRSLSGLVQCQTCQKGLRIVQVTQRKKQHQYLYMRCQGCCYSLSYERLLEKVIQLICEQLPERTRQFNPIPLEERRSTLGSQIQKNEATLQHLDHLQQEGILDDLSLHQRRYHLRAENAVLTQYLEQLPPSNVADIAQTLSIVPFWQDLTESERRSYFREFLQTIWVNAQGDVSLSFFV